MTSFASNRRFLEWPTKQIRSHLFYTVGFPLESSIMKTWLRLTLVTVTIGGGFTGFALTFEKLWSPQGLGIAAIVIYIVFLLLFAFATASGLLFVHDPHRVRPLLAALALQIPVVSTPLLVYKFCAGAYLIATVGSPRQSGNFGLYFGWSAGLGTMFRFSWNQKDFPGDIGVNLCALLLFILLWKSTQTPQPAKLPAIPVAEDAQTDQPNHLPPNDAENNSAPTEPEVF